MKVWAANWDNSGLAVYSTLDAFKAAVDDYIWDEEDINAFGSEGYVSIDDYVYGALVEVDE